MKKVVHILLVLCLLLGLSACKDTQKAETAITAAPTVAETTEAVIETTVEVTESVGSFLLEQPEDGKVCVSFLPTEVGQWRYVVIPDQEAAVAAYEKAVNAVYSDEWWIKGDKTIGLTVVYNGEFRDFVDSGELVYALGRTKAEDARELYDLCANAAREAGWKDAVTPDHLRGIVSAVLQQADTHIALTDSEKLAALETMLTAGTFSLGGTGCPFGALLTVTTEAGKTFTLALATDSCGVWMSEGCYYEFGSDSQPLYDLFGITLTFGTITP